jgi:hypothetical protein
MMTVSAICHDGGLRYVSTPAWRNLRGKIYSIHNWLTLQMIEASEIETERWSLSKVDSELGLEA